MWPDAEIDIVSGWAEELREEMENEYLAVEPTRLLNILMIRMSVQAINSFRWKQVFRTTLIEQLRKELGILSDRSSITKKLAYAFCILMEQMDNKILDMEPEPLPAEFAETEVKLEDDVLESFESTSAARADCAELPTQMTDSTLKTEEESTLMESSYAFGQEMGSVPQHCPLFQDDSELKEETIEDFDVTQASAYYPTEVKDEDVKKEMDEYEYPIDYGEGSSEMCDAVASPSSSYEQPPELEAAYSIRTTQPLAARCRPFVSSAQLRERAVAMRYERIIECTTCDFRTTDRDLMQEHKTELECAQCRMKLSACMESIHMERHERHRTNIRVAVAKRKAISAAKPKFFGVPLAPTVESKRVDAERLAQTKRKCVHCEFTCNSNSDRRTVRETLDMHMSSVHAPRFQQDARECQSCHYRTMFKPTWDWHVREMFTCDVCNKRVIACGKESHMKYHEKQLEKRARVPPSTVVENRQNMAKKRRTSS